MPKLTKKAIRYGSAVSEILQYKKTNKHISYHFIITKIKDSTREEEDIGLFITLVFKVLK